MADYPEQIRAVHTEEAPVFETLADAEQSARLVALGNFVAGGFEGKSWRPDLQRQMAVRSRNWKVGDTHYQGIYYPDTGECGIAWFRNGGRSYEQLRFSRLEDTGNMKVVWQGSDDVSGDYDLRITGTEWNASDDMLHYEAAETSASATCDSDCLEYIMDNSFLPAELRVRAAEIGREQTEARLAALLPEFEQSRKRPKRVLGRLARRSLSR